MKINGYLLYRIFKIRSITLKRFISLLILGFLIASSAFLCSCEDKDDVSLKDSVESRVTAYQTDLSDSLSSFKDNDSIKSFLISWAKHKSVACQEDDYGNIIMSIPSSGRYVKANPTIVVCSYDCKNIRSGINQLTSALCLVKSGIETGELQVIFTKSEGGNFEGMKSISPDYFQDNSNVFVLSDSVNESVSEKTCGMNTYKFTSPVEYTTPTGTLAYKVSIKGMNGGFPDAQGASYDNPIEALTDILAFFKNNSIIFELSNIEGGISDSIYASDAEMTLVFDNDCNEKGLKKINSVLKKYESSNAEENPDLEVTCTQVAMPESVMDSDSANRFVGAQYTLPDGAFNKSDDDEEIISVCNIGCIRNSDSGIEILASGTCISNEALKQIDEQYKNICEISNLTFEKTGSIPIWKASNKQKFRENFAGAYKSYSGKRCEFIDSLQSSITSIIKTKNPKCNMLSISFGENETAKYTGTILTFMRDLPHEEETQS